MGAGITNIEINSNWFYHRLKEESLDQIILSGGLKSSRKLGAKTRRNTFNGRDFISLSKKMSMLEGTSFKDYSYTYYIDLHYAYVIDEIPAIKTRYIKEYNEFHRLLSSLPFPLRFSLYLDEYQVKDEIPLDRMKGIKIPNLKSDFVDLSYYEAILEDILEKMDDTGYSLPFIDVEEKKMISKEKIKEYIKEEF